MKKIMIVEDDKTIAEELLFLLNNSDYEGIILKDFENSKKEILDNNTDLILLDINIHYLNGELLLKEIRKESNIPVIMVTSKESEADEVISYSYGADDEYVECLKTAASCEGHNPEEVDYLMAQGFTLDEIEEYIYS